MVCKIPLQDFPLRGQHFFWGKKGESKKFDGKGRGDWGLKKKRLGEGKQCVSTRGPSFEEKLSDFWNDMLSQDRKEEKHRRT